MKGNQIFERSVDGSEMILEERREVFGKQ